MTYPLTFRRHVLKIQHQEALTFKATAHRFGIGIASLVRWHHSLEPKGRPQQSYKIDMEALKKDVVTFPDDYLYERAARFHVTPTGIYLALRRMGITYKKILCHPKRNQEARTTFQETIQQLKTSGRPILYLDESGFAVDMPRTRGYAPRGARCYSLCDWNAKGRINAIGALSGKRLITVSLFSCNVDSDVFHHWMINDLLPKAPKGSIMVMDNAAFHKRADTQKAITDAGHHIQYLPPYSPA